MLLLYALIGFSLAAIGGLVMVVIRSRGTNPPIVLAVGHGGLAAVSLVLLFTANVSLGFAGKPAIALGLFLLAALGGFYLFSLQLKGRLIPIPVVALHAVAAVSGFLVLLLAVLGK